MKIFAIGTICPITGKDILFPRDCVFTNIIMGRRQIKNAFPELKCAYLKIKLDPKKKEAIFKCCHTNSIMCMDDEKTYKGKKSKNKAPKYDNSKNPIIGYYKEEER